MALPCIPDSLLLSCTRVTTWKGKDNLTNASGFFFSRNRQLYLVTSRHVVRDEASSHQPDRIVIEIHSDPDNIARCVDISTTAALRETD